MDRDEYIRIATLIYTEPKEFDRIMRNMTIEELRGYERQRFLFLQEQELAREEKRLH